MIAQLPAGQGRPICPQQVDVIGAVGLEIEPSRFQCNDLRTRVPGQSELGQMDGVMQARGTMSPGRLDHSRFRMQ